MKKAQMSEFVSIIIFVIVLVVGLMIMRVNSHQTTTKQIEESLANYRNTYIMTTSSLFPYLTTQGEMLGILMGRYICYKDPIMTSRTGENIHFFPAIRNKLDEVYEEDMWAIELNSSMCITSKDFFASECYIDSTKTYYSFEMLISVPCRYDDVRGVLHIILN